MIEEKPNIKLIDEDKTVTISLFTYSRLLNDSFKLESYKIDNLKLDTKLHKLYYYIKHNDNIDMDIVKSIYYGIEEEED